MNNGKFIIKNGCLVIEDKDEAIPEDEPVFILRACDTQALGTLRSYQATVPQASKDWYGIQQVIHDFTAFRVSHGERMRPPEEAY